MDILAISPFQIATSDQILSTLSEADADLVVLPGYARNMPSPVSVQQVIRPGVAIFLEEVGKKGETGKKHSSTPFLVTSSSVTPMPKQIFCTNPCARDIDHLAQAFGRRTFRIANRAVTFVLCGEIIAFNPDGSVKHNRHLPFDVLVNPAHTPMGRWHVLGRKLESLSRQSVALHVTNNDRDRQKLTTDVRIYHRGSNVTRRKHNLFSAWARYAI